MSETLFRFLVGEIHFIRVTCKKCQTIMEIPLNRVSLPQPNLSCPSCLTVVSDVRHLVNLADALLSLQKSDGIDVGFSLPVNGIAD